MAHLQQRHRPALPRPRRSSSPSARTSQARLAVQGRRPPHFSGIRPPPRAIKSPRTSPMPRTFSLVLLCEALRPCRRLRASARTHPTPS
jgi:hypothetical protein